MTLNDETWDWLAKRAGAKRVKEWRVIPGDSAPCWRYEPGWTEWKNGAPKHYTRSVSKLTVGQGWLAQMFPAQHAVMRLAGHEDLVVTAADITAAERGERDREQLMRLAHESAQRTIALSNRLAAVQCRSLDPEEDRLYAD